MLKSMKYCEYFNVDEDYFPCIDESAINKGVKWKDTYPHETFINLLTKTEKMLSGATNKSLWIHGAYGTGKSRCAYTLKKLLEAPEAEVRSYWDRYAPLQKNSNLLEKLIGHRNRGIVTAYRYASGGIATPQQLFLAVQESIKKALDDNNVAYKGENTLKEAVLSWLEDETHKQFMDALLKKPEWSFFSQSTAQDIIISLKKGGDVSSLMHNILNLAAKEGITALNLTSDSLRRWIIDVIEKNNIRLVFVWDEFSDYFRQNSKSLGEFQKIVSICQESPFYLVIVTHPISSISVAYDDKDKNNPWSVVQQRFESVEISLPDNIAFYLIGHAFSPKDAAKSQWQDMIDDLTDYVPTSIKKVGEAVRIESEDVIRKMLPLHPMAALVLKNIAANFQSNQRSMFDFIKTPKDVDAKAFQWFIQNTSPEEDRFLLTVDMLWDFFYEKGKVYLPQTIRGILDIFSRRQEDLDEKQQIVLKTVLILQAIDQSLNSAISILWPTDQNLSYVFEGDNTIKNSLRGILQSLVGKKILLESKRGRDQKLYTAAQLGGDIDTIKEKLRETSTTEKLVEGDGFSQALNLSPALKLRFAEDAARGNIRVVTKYSFKKVLDELQRKNTSWRFYALLALAKNDQEAQIFRTQIRNVLNSNNDINEQIVVIDALSTPLGEEAFDQYVDYAAYAEYYEKSNQQLSKTNDQNARNVLERDWKNRIENGTFMVWNHASKAWEMANGAAAVHTILQNIVLNKFKYVQDFTKRLTESQLKPAKTSPKQAAKFGIEEGEVTGALGGCEKSVLGKFWGKKNYWQDDALAGEPIVAIKKALEAKVAEAFKNDGRISIGDVCNLLIGKFGFSLSSLSSFLIGFLLKEYSADPYRYMDEEGYRDAMTPDKLSEMIGSCLTAMYNGKEIKSTYIVSLTEEEKSFCDFTAEVWGIDAKACSSPQKAGVAVSQKMQGLGFPMWCLKYVDSTGVYPLVEQYIKLVQNKGEGAQNVANTIGKIAMQNPAALASELKALLTQDNCIKGMKIFLESFQDGKLLTLAGETGAPYMADIKRRFSNVEYPLWSASTGEGVIANLITEYELVKLSNSLLNVAVQSKDASFGKWKEQLNFMGVSCDAAKDKLPHLGKIFISLLRIARGEQLTPQDIKTFLNELQKHEADIKDLLNNPLAAFMDIYNPYLEGLTEEECKEIMARVSKGMPVASATDSNRKVKEAVKEYIEKRTRTQLLALWREKSGAKSPAEWSKQHRTPILCCITKDYSETKKVFSTINSKTATEADNKEALSFITQADFFANLSSQEYRDRCFKERVLGKYAKLLPAIEDVRDMLEGTDISAYDWNDNPAIQKKVKDMADAEYQAGGSDEVINMIEGMDDAELKQWLTRIVKKDMNLGIEIIANKGE